MQVTFVRGEHVTMMNYTPSGDVAAGEVVIVNDIVGIAHRPIVANELGALALQDGIYRGTGDAAIAAGVHVYWNNAADKLTETIGTNKYMGKTVTACSGDGQSVDFVHLQPSSSAAGS